MTSDLVLVREPEARAALAGRRVREQMLLPPYPALGTGALRVVRVSEEGDETVLLCAYEGYERL